MHARRWLIFLFVCPLCAGQNPANSAKALRTNPAALLAAAAPHYNYNSPTLKPWHIKVDYRLYNSHGKPSSRGTYQYWWVSPKIHRSTWTRGSETYTEWHTADGRSFYAGSGIELDFFEYQLRSDLLSPLPDPEDYDPAKAYFVQEKKKFGDTKEPCFMIVPRTLLQGQLPSVRMGIFPSYCFESTLPVLLAKWSFDSMTVGFSNLVKFQGNYLPRQIMMYDGKRKILSATVDAIYWIAPADPALIPPMTAKVQGSAALTIPSARMQDRIVFRVPPVYSPDARDAHVGGDVILDVLIGRDGRVHNMRAVSAPWPSLAASAMWAVSQWRYSPYLVNGEPVEVRTTINIPFGSGY